MQKQDCSRATAFRKRRKSLDRQRTEREKLIAETAKRQFCPMIKPSDTWNFDGQKLIYPRLILDESHGYIPGELYANCLFWFARPGDLVVAPMAGSGMIHHVYLDRALWTTGLPQPWDVDLRMFDLSPRGPYEDLIEPWNILDGFPPVERSPDYVIADVPYLGIVREQYSRRNDDIANMDATGWTDAIRGVARSCAQVGAKRCTIVVASAFVNSATRVRVPCSEIVRKAWYDAGYQFNSVCYADRRIQQYPSMARWNNIAREKLLPMSGMAEVLTFDWLCRPSLGLR
jgi:ParB family chromosome partitioning protein